MKFTFVRRTLKEDGTHSRMCIAMNNANTFGVSAEAGTPIYLQYDSVVNHLNALAEKKGLVPKDPEKGVEFIIPGEWKIVPMSWKDREGNLVEPVTVDGVRKLTIEPA